MQQEVRMALTDAAKRRRKKTRGIRSCSPLATGNAAGGSVQSPADPRWVSLQAHNFSSKRKHPRLEEGKNSKKTPKKQKLNNTVISCVWPCLRKQDFCRQHEGKKWLSYLKNKSLISRKTLTSMRHQFVLWEAERNHKPWWASRLSRFWLVQCEMLLLSPGLSSWIWWRGRTPFYFCFTLR